MMEIKAALDAAFAAYADALDQGAADEVALSVGLARYRAFFPNTITSVFEAAIQAAREKSQAAAATATATATATDVAGREAAEAP